MRTRHVEKHFTAAGFVRDMIIGMSDGLTVPFALAAGLSGAVDSSHIVVTAGLAEIAAGSISMGLGGYLASRSDAEHYQSERGREIREVKEIPEEEKKEVRDVFREYGLTDQEIAPILDRFQAQPKMWVDFMMRFELGIEKPEPNRALISALTIGGSYLAGGFIPLIPYMVVAGTKNALPYSILVTLVSLFVFGYGKGRFTGTRAWRSAFQTLLVGSIAAGVAFGLATVVSK
jgi:VIT1/CCC1 family predicted Fe2+/Mn2+ transporter